MVQKLTTYDIEQRLFLAWGDNYKLLSYYQGWRKKIAVYCNKHKIIKFCNSRDIDKWVPCDLCSEELKIKKRKDKIQDEFYKKFDSNKYKIKEINLNDKYIVIVCNIHNLEEKIRFRDINNKIFVCLECYKEYLKDNPQPISNINLRRKKSVYMSKRLSNDEFLKRLKESKGDLYTPLSEYVNCRVKMRFFCNKHKIEFEALPRAVLKSYSCPECSKERWKQSYHKTKKHIRKYSIEEIKNKLIDKYGDKFEYDFTGYKNIKSRIYVTCNDCGHLFLVSPDNLLSKRYKIGCPKCGKKAQLTREEFIEKSKKLHNNKYIYDLIPDVFNYYTKVPIICKIHGVWYQSIGKHLQGQGCPRCAKNISKFENEVVIYLMELGIKSIDIYRNEKNILYPKEVDIYIPKFKFGVECCGDLWHSLLYINSKNYHKVKADLADKNKIKLFTLFEFEWNDDVKKEVWKSLIKKECKIYDNVVKCVDCKIRSVNEVDFEKFLIKNSIYSNIENVDYRFGLYYKNNLIYCFGLQVINDNSIVLKYFVEHNNYKVFGGFSKLFNYIINVLKFKNIISYLDRRIYSSLKNELVKNNFKFISEIRPKVLKVIKHN